MSNPFRGMSPETDKMIDELEGATATPQVNADELHFKIVNLFYSGLSLEQMNALPKWFIKNADRNIAKFKADLDADRQKHELDARKRQTIKVIGSLVKSGAISNSAASLALSLHTAALKEQRSKLDE